MLSSRPLLLVAVTSLLAACATTSTTPRLNTNLAGFGTVPITIAAPPPAPQIVTLTSEPAGENLSQSFDTQPHESLPRVESVTQTFDTQPHESTPYIGSLLQSFDTAPHEPLPPTIDPAPAAPPPPATHVQLGPIQFISQTVNNCGPASVAEVLGFWGIQRTQFDTQGPLRGDNPYGMTTSGVPAYVNSLGLDVLLGTAGTQDTIKDLLRAGFPVIVNQLVAPNDRVFHYRPVDGFDDASAAFTSSDPLLGASYTIGYDQFDPLWTYTGKRFMVIYPPDKQDALNAALAAAGWNMASAEGAAAAQSWDVSNVGGPPPVTSAVLAGKDGRPLKPAPSGWYAGPVTVSFSASDPVGFGVAATSFALDGKPEEMYKKPIVISAPGKHTLEFRSVTFDGGREDPKQLEIDLAGAPPTTTATVGADRSADGSYVAAGQAVLTLSAADNGGGVSSTSYSDNGGPSQAYSAPVTFGPGSHVISYGSTDLAGDVETPGSVTLTVGPAPQPSAGAASSSPPTGAANAALGSAASASARNGTPGSAAPANSGTIQPSSASAGNAALAPAGSAAPASPAPGSPAASPWGGTYNVCTLYDQSAGHKSGGTLSLRFNLCDAAAKNLSSADLKINLVRIVGPLNTPHQPKLSALRFEPSFSGYEADLTTDGIGNGAYIVQFTIAGDSAIHQLQFLIS